MSLTTVVLAVAAAAVFPLLLWAISRTVTATGERAPYSRGRAPHYLAGRLDGVRITALIDGGDELLVSLTPQITDESQAAGHPLGRVFRITASECSLARVRRWRDEGTLLRAYLGHDGASCSPIPRWAGMPPANRPPPSPGRPASGRSPRISHQLTTANRPVQPWRWPACATGSWSGSPSLMSARGLRSAGARQSWMAAG